MRLRIPSAGANLNYQKHLTKVKKQKQSQKKLEACIVPLIRQHVPVLLFLLFRMLAELLRFIWAALKVPCQGGALSHPTEMLVSWAPCL